MVTCTHQQTAFKQQACLPRLLALDIIMGRLVCGRIFGTFLLRCFAISVTAFGSGLRSCSLGLGAFAGFRCSWRLLYKHVILLCAGNELLQHAEGVLDCACIHLRAASVCFMGPPGFTTVRQNVQQ